MHALHFETGTDWGFAALMGTAEDLALGTRADSVPVSSYYEGLYRLCRERYDTETIHEVLDDTHNLLFAAGYSSWHQVAKKDLAKLVFSSTREWEYIGESGTIDIVRVQRDYTRSVVGEELFWESYQGMQTVDGQSYYCAVP